jgi:hypothetical protein
MSITICGKHGRLQRWHILLLGTVLLAILVAVPTAVTQANKNKEEEDQQGEASIEDEVHLSYEWTREEIMSIVSPSISHASTFLQTADAPSSSPQSRAVDWLTTGGGTDIITGPTKESVEWRVKQRYVLAVLYYSTEGERWKEQFDYLDSGSHECDWALERDNGWKTTECSEEKEVKIVNLYNNGLGGTIPGELASLNLTDIDFLNNGIKGTVPEELYTMKNLGYLNLGYNELTGTVASELGDMNNLGFLMLDHNVLTGTIPPELGQLTEMSGWLTLEGNKLVGTVPESFVHLTNLPWIYLSQNDLEGSVEFMCDALKPLEAPGGVNKGLNRILLELYIDRDEVECSCCNCCPYSED